MSSDQIISSQYVVPTYDSVMHLLPDTSYDGIPSAHAKRMQQAFQTALSCPKCHGSETLPKLVKVLLTTTSGGSVLKWQIALATDLAEKTLSGKEQNQALGYLADSMIEHAEYSRLRSITDQIGQNKGNAHDILLPIVQKIYPKQHLKWLALDIAKQIPCTDQKIETLARFAREAANDGDIITAELVQLQIVKQTNAHFSSTVFDISMHIKNAKKRVLGELIDPLRNYEQKPSSYPRLQQEIEDTCTKLNISRPEAIDPIAGMTELLAENGWRTSSAFRILSSQVLKFCNHKEAADLVFKICEAIRDEFSESLDDKLVILAEIGISLAMVQQPKDEVGYVQQFLPRVYPKGQINQIALVFEMVNRYKFVEPRKAFELAQKVLMDADLAKAIDSIEDHLIYGQKFEDAIWIAEHLDESHKEKRDQLFVSILAKMAEKDPAQAHDRLKELCDTYKLSQKSVLDASILINAEKAKKEGTDVAWEKLRTAVEKEIPSETLDQDDLCHLFSKLAIVGTKIACK